MAKRKTGVWWDQVVLKDFYAIQVNDIFSWAFEWRLHTVKVCCCQYLHALSTPVEQIFEDRSGQPRSIT